MARLSNATDLTLPDSISPLSRRYADPPALWAIVAIGSLAIHVVLLLGMRWLNVRVSLGQSETDLVPIEIMSAAPQDVVSQAADSAPVIGTTASPENSASLPLAQSTATSDIAVPNVEAPDIAVPDIAVPNAEAPDIAAQRRIADRLTPEAIAPPYPNTNPGSVATPPPETPDSPSRFQAPTPQTSRLSPTGNTADSIVPPSDRTNSNGSNDSTTASRPNSGSPTSNSTGSPSSSTPPSSESSGQGEPVIPPVTVARQASATRVVVNLNVSPIPASDSPSDLIGPDGQIARPKNLNPEFVINPTNSDCLLDGDSFNYLGKVLEFYLEIETIAPDRGRVVGEPRLRGDSSGSTGYDQLAACLLRQVDFYPAFTPTPTGNLSPPSSEIVVQIKIDLASN